MKEHNEGKQKVAAGPNFLAYWLICDFEICADYDELKAVMAKHQLSRMRSDICNAGWPGLLYRVLPPPGLRLRGGV